MIVVRQIPDELHEAILERRPAGASASCRPWACSTTGSSRWSAGRETRTGASSSRPSRTPRVHDARRSIAGPSRPGARPRPARACPCGNRLRLPEVGTLYPADDTTRVTVEGLTRQLEGASRPATSDGLSTVMLKMLHLVRPGAPVSGQRHAQQVVIVRRMLRDLFMNVAARDAPPSARTMGWPSRARTRSWASRSATRPPASTRH